MKLKNSIILVGVLVLLDQILKIWIKTNMALDESIQILPWFHLHFVENNGAAFGMQLNTGGAFDWGNLLLSLFRVAMRPGADFGGCYWQPYRLDVLRYDFHRLDAPYGGNIRRGI